jgi:hypothetical protein
VRIRGYGPDKPMGATSSGSWQQRTGLRLCTWRKASRSRTGVRSDAGVVPKGGEARPAVYRSERSGGVTRPDRIDSSPVARDLLRAGSNASKGRTAWRGRLRRGSRKRHEPQDWKRGATPAQGREGASRQGGGKPRRRNVRRVGDLSPKRRWRQPRGSGLLGPQDSGGAIFGNLNETIVRRTGRSSEETRDDPQGRAARRESGGLVGTMTTKAMSAQAGVAERERKHTREWSSILFQARYRPVECPCRLGRTPRPRRASAKANEPKSPPVPIPPLPRPGSARRVVTRQREILRRARARWRIEGEAATKGVSDVGSKEHP